RADGPAPDVDLRFGGAAEIDAGIGVGHHGDDGVTVFVEFMAAVGQHGGNGIFALGAFDAPLDVEPEIAEGLFGPEGLVAGEVDAGVAVDDPVLDLPDLGMAGFVFPSVEVFAV